VPPKSVDIEKMIQAQRLFSVVVAGELNEEELARRFSSVFGDEMVGLTSRVLTPGKVVKFVACHESTLPRGEVFGRIKAEARSSGLAFAIYPDLPDPPEFRVALMDMDSTLINEEVIEELAAFAGVREHVAHVTRLAMEGKLDFHEALRERVKLLAGQPAEILDKVYECHISPTPGVEALIAGFKKQGIRTAVVSGGFVAVVEKFAKKLGLDHAYANTLEVKDGKLTGVVVGEIVDANVKKRTLEELCVRYRCELRDSIAIGDGANDLKMMQISGLGVAFCAKPIVQEQALAAVNHRRLDDVLLLMG